MKILYVVTHDTCKSFCLLSQSIKVPIFCIYRRKKKVLFGAVFRYYKIPATFFPLLDIHILELWWHHREKYTEVMKLFLYFYRESFVLHECCWMFKMDFLCVTTSLSADPMMCVLLKVIDFVNQNRKPCIHNMAKTFTCDKWWCNWSSALWCISWESFIVDDEIFILHNISIA